MNRKKLLLVSIAFFMAAAFSLFPVHHVFADEYPTLFEDDFNSYNVGYLNNQGGWNCSGGAYVRVFEDPHETGNAVRNTYSQAGSCYREFTGQGLTQGSYSADVYVYTDLNNQAGTILWLLGRAATTQHISVEVEDCVNGLCELISHDYSSGSLQEKEYSIKVQTGVRHKINIIWKVEDSKIHFAVILDDNNISEWYETQSPLHANQYIDKLYFFITNLAVNKLYVDDITGWVSPEWSPPSWKNCADYETPYECVGLGMWLCVWDYDTDICVDREVDSAPDPRLEGNLKIELERWYASGLGTGIDFAFEWNIEPYLFPPNPYTYESDEVRVVAYKRSTAEYCTYTDNLPPDLEFGWFGKGIKDRITFGTAGIMEDLSDLFCKGAGLYDYRMEIDNHDGSKTSSSIWYQFQYIDDLPASYTDLEEDTWPATLTWYQKLFHNAKENFRHEFNRAYDAFISLFPINWVHGFLSDITYVVFEYEQEDLGYLAMPVSLYWENVREEEDPPDFTVDMLPIEGLVGGTTILGSYTSDFIITGRQIITYVIWIVFAIFIVMRVKSFISGLSGHGESPYSMGFHP